MKPLLYGGLAARLAGVPAMVGAVAGLGYLIDSAERRSGWLRRLALPLLRAALGHPNLRVIFQNREDRDFLVGAAALRDSQVVLIRGSGIELDRYRAVAEPPPPVVVMLASRLLRPKGIAEFVDAARLLHARGLDIRFRVAGEADPGNPLTVTAEEIERWRADGDVEILGRREDVPQLMASSHIVCLPSYYGEGVPRVLLEAAACGRPVVTTDSPGCRDAVEPGSTGLLVPPRDVEALADAIAVLAGDAARREAMGAAARRLAERAFGIESVVQRHLDIYAELVPRERD
jgi:glycosyltransferase involved in cell wall biosynthesis